MAPTTMEHLIDGENHLQKIWHYANKESDNENVWDLTHETTWADNILRKENH